MVYIKAARSGHVTIFSTGGKFQQVSNFMELPTLTQAAALEEGHGAWNRENPTEPVCSRAHLYPQIQLLSMSTSAYMYLSE